MWIALKSWYLWYSEQLVGLNKTQSISCELLSKVDIFDIRNNSTKLSNSWKSVVNCSQKLISLIFGTTYADYYITWNELWIALKSWYLWYSEQQLQGLLEECSCCELLSKVDIFDIRNNVVADITSPHVVVNCSQKLISLIFGTTLRGNTNSELSLWIALKSWYLWYSEQLDFVWWEGFFGCELLSKVDIFDIRNNEMLPFKTTIVVVNCSQKLISLIFGTTKAGN